MTSRITLKIRRLLKAESYGPVPRSRPAPHRSHVEQRQGHLFRAPSSSYLDQLADPRELPSTESAKSSISSRKFLSLTIIHYRIKEHVSTRPDTDLQQGTLARGKNALNAGVSRFALKEDIRPMITKNSESLCRDIDV